MMVLSMDSFYKPLSSEQSALAHRNEYDFDAPDAIDFDMLVEKLHDVKAGYACESNEMSPFFMSLYIMVSYLANASQEEGANPGIFIRAPCSVGEDHYHLLAPCSRARGDLCIA